MAKIVKRSVVPIYLAGVPWLAFGLFFSLSRVEDYIVCGLISGASFVVGLGLFPTKSFETPDTEESQKESKKDAKKKAKETPKQEPKEQPKQEEPQKTSTGNPKIDALLVERDRALSEMRRLNDNIADEKISDQIDRLESRTRTILDHVVSNPTKLPQIRRFLDYYLPTTLKILNAYDRMDATGISGENISATKEKVAVMMDSICIAFDKQLDTLFSDEALDITTDIKVMEAMLAREGLGNYNMK